MRRRLSFLAVFAALGVAGWFFFVNEVASAFSPLAPVGAWRDGDILLMEGKTWRSRFVRCLQAGGSPFSHVGVVDVSGAEVFVIHADPFAGKVVRQRWQDILAAGRVRHGKLLRVAALTDAMAGLIKAKARQFAALGVPFDDEFRWEKADRLYCTELVARAYEAAGICLIVPKRRYVLPADLLAAPGVFPVSVAHR